MDGCIINTYTNITSVYSEPVSSINLNYSSILETYTIQELLELNDLTEEDCLRFLVEEEFIDLPEIIPIDLDD